MKKAFYKIIRKAGCVLTLVSFCCSGICPVFADGVTFDYSCFNTADISDYNSGLLQSDKTKTSFDLADGVLKITTNGGEDAKTHYPTIPLGDYAVKSANGPFSVEVTAKFYNSGTAVVRNLFSLSGGGKTCNFGLGWCLGQNISAGNLGLLLNANNRSDGMWTYKAEEKTDLGENANLNRTDNNVDIKKDSDKYFLGLKEASENFYTYRWDIDPQTKTFKFYFKKIGDSEWTEPYGEFYTINPYTAEKGDRFSEKGVFPTGELPDTISELKYQQRVANGETTVISVSKISVEQKNLELTEKSKTIENNKAVLKFNRPVDSSTLNAVTVSKNGKNLSADTDYKISVANGGINSESEMEISFLCGIEEGEKIEINISKDINSKDNYAKPQNEFVVEYSITKNIYVSSLGDDLNDGAQNSPVKTLERAKELFKQQKNDDFLPVVYILDDIVLNQKLVLDSECAGITFSSCNGKKVSVSSGFCGGTISDATEEDLGGRLSKEHLKNIIKWDLSNCEDLKNDAETLDYSYYNPELVDGEEIKTVARWPDSGWAYTGEVTCDKRTKDENGAADGKYVGFEFKTTAPIDKMTLDNAKINGFWSWDYRFTKGTVLGKGEAEGLLEVKVNSIISSEYFFNSNRRYYLYNIPEEITSPGEYYIDYDEKVLYYYPEDKDNINLSLTGLKDGMFEIKNGCDNVSFLGINFKNTRGTVIDANESDNILISDCGFKNIGGRALYIHNTYNTKIEKSYFGDIGDTAVEISGGENKSLTPSNSCITNCEFENGGRIAGTYCPFVQLGAIASGEQVKGIYGTAIGINVENNYFHNHMHSAIIFEGNDFIIKNNIFDNVVNQTQDAGAIYSRVNPTYWGNEITNNIFRNIRSFKKDEAFADVFAVYLDDLLPDTKVCENLFENCSAAANFGGGQSHTFSKNLVYDCFEGAYYSVRGNRAEAAGGGYLYTYLQSMKNAVENAGLDMSIWYDKYKNFKTYTQKVEEYAAAVKSGEASVSDIKNEAYDILHITDEVYSDNIFISPNAENGISKSGAAFCTVYEGSSTKNQNVNAEHNYLSGDLSLADINGTQITLSSKVTDLGYEAPNVSNAGILDMGTYQKNSGRDFDGKYKNASSLYFDGYVTEDFEGYEDETPAEKANELKLSGDGTISAQGYLKILGGGKTDITLPLFTGKNFAFEINAEGTASIETEECVFNLECEKDKTTVLMFDFEKSAVEKYIKTNDVFELKEVTDANVSVGFNVISICADSDLKIYHLGASGFEDKNICEGYLNMDFEDANVPCAAEMYSGKFVTYSPYGAFYAEIAEEGENKVFCLSNQKHTSAQNTNAEIIFLPIKTSDNIVNIEFKTKAESASGVQLLKCLSPSGFNLDMPEQTVDTEVLKQNKSANHLETAGGTKVADAAEWSKGYVDIRLSVDKNNSKITVFKNSGGGYEKLAEVLNVSVPDYINKLKIVTSSAANTEAKYYFDDIKVYSAKKEQNFASFGPSVEGGKNLCLAPDYISGICGGVAAAAVYDGKGTLLAYSFSKYYPGFKLELEIPEDENNENNYILKRFVFADSDSITPVVSAKTYR